MAPNQKWRVCDQKKGPADQKKSLDDQGVKFSAILRQIGNPALSSSNLAEKLEKGPEEGKEPVEQAHAFVVGFTVEGEGAARKLDLTDRSGSELDLRDARPTLRPAVPRSRVRLWPDLSPSTDNVSFVVDLEVCPCHVRSPGASGAVVPCHSM